MTASHTYLNQIFYIPKKFDDLNCLSKYMLSHDVLKTYTQINILEPTIEKRIELFKPRQTDTLFWGLYVIHHSISEYHMIQNKHKNKEMEEKQTILSFMQQNNDSIKTAAKQFGNKLSQIRLKEIQSELLLDKNTSNYVFFVMCIYYKINAVIQNESTYMHFHTGSSDTYLFTRQKHAYETDLTPITPDQLQNIQATSLLIPFDQEKPLKGMTGYKVNDLEKMADKLHISYENSKKLDLYNAILVKLTELQN